MARRVDEPLGPQPRQGQRRNRAAPTDEQRAEILSLHAHGDMSGYAISKRLGISAHHVYATIDPDHHAKNRARAARNYRTNEDYRAAQQIRARRVTRDDEPDAVRGSDIACAVRVTRQAVSYWGLPTDAKGMVAVADVRRALHERDYDVDAVMGCLTRAHLVRQHRADARRAKRAEEERARRAAAERRRQESQERWITQMQTVVDLWYAGLPVRVIATRLGRTEGTTGQLIDQLRMAGVVLPRRRPGDVGADPITGAPRVTADHHAAVRAWGRAGRPRGTAERNAPPPQ